MIQAPTQVPTEAPTEAPTIAPQPTPFDEQTEIPAPSTEPSGEPAPGDGIGIRLRVVDQPSSLGLAGSILDSVASRYFGS